MSLSVKSLFALLLPLTLIFWVASCTPTQPAKSEAQTEKSAVAIADMPNTYVGNAACTECHTSIAAVHQKSRHNNTLRFMTQESLGEQTPPLEKIPKTDFMMQIKGNHFEFGRADGQGGGMKKLDLAFGSGKTGMAFAAVVGPDQLAEARVSWFPPRREWYETPGQQSLPKGTPGNVSQGESARQCVGCHTITLPSNNLMPEEKFLGVGCEACHGPGNRHVAAMQAGEMAQVFMDKLGSLDGNAMSDLCGRCHRTEKDVIAKNLDRSKTTLFQAYGLAQSECFIQGQGKLTCVTCHDPHTDVSMDEKGYNAVCMNCHASPQTRPEKAVPAKACPVNPKEKCITCHMPKKHEPVFPGSPRHVADHYIRVIDGLKKNK